VFCSFLSFGCGSAKTIITCFKEYSVWSGSTRIIGSFTTCQNSQPFTIGCYCKINYFAALKNCVLLINEQIMIKFMALSLFAASTAFANNVQVGVPSLPSTSTIQFTIRWDNSWRVAAAPSNWDAIWVFVKYQDCATNLWNHVDLSTVVANHSVTGAQLEVLAVADGKGIYLRQNANGVGNISSATVTLKFNTLIDAGYNYRVFGIEMVNIPSGDFYIGDGTRGTSLFGFSDVNPFPPKLITNAIQTAGIGAASNYTDVNFGSTAPLPSTYPIGWNSFYCMKYEISQEQYVAFLNTLTYDQQASVTANSPSSAVGTLAIAAATFSRNGIRIQTSGTLNNIPAVYGNDLNNNGTFNEGADGQNIACNWLQWSDLTAYLDWSALRPITEFEFEKVCRGTNTALPGEFAWGTTAILQAQSGAITNSGVANEVSSTSGSGLCAFGSNNTAQGPLRCGFAATALTNRAQAGASFYGCLDMSGNVMEQCVGGQNFNYSNFTNLPGDGSLSSSGTANTVGWPTTGGGRGGAIMRGGDWFTNITNSLAVSDRVYMINNSNQIRNLSVGGRGGR
jgi:formylglycine-generating enzyme required for sulfatase activity